MYIFDGPKKFDYCTTLGPHYVMVFVFHVSFYFEFVFLILEDVSNGYADRVNLSYEMFFCL